jgi:hypothetical protein
MFAISQPSTSNFKGFSRSKEQFFLTVSQKNFINKILFFFYQKLQLIPILIINIYVNGSLKKPCDYASTLFDKPRENIYVKVYFFVGQRVLQNATFLSVSWKVQQSANFFIAP